MDWGNESIRRGVLGLASAQLNLPSNPTFYTIIDKLPERSSEILGGVSAHFFFTSGIN